MEQRVLCDAKAGELIFSYNVENRIAEEFINEIYKSDFYKESHVEIIESMEQKLSSMDLEKDYKIPVRLNRLRVPNGQEIFKMNWLFQRYNEFCINRFNDWLYRSGQSEPDLNNITFSLKYPPEIVTNSYYTTASVNGFSFTKVHEENLKMINPNAYKTIHPKKSILIIDSGISQNNHCNVVSKKNFLDNDNKDDVTDETGHGSAIAEIIQDVLPKTKLLIYKVVDKTKYATEWDLLAALCAKNNASIINVSIAYGLEDYTCNKCGRLTEEARSIVLERIIFHLSEIGKVVVAAAGNKMSPTLSYPARLNSCIAIMSMNSQYEISDFSNRSTTDQLRGKHEFVFLAPGGNMQPVENLFSDYINTRGMGTSFSAAYASAVICRVWSNNEYLSVSGLLDKLKNDHAYKKFPTYNKATHGNGLLVF